MPSSIRSHSSGYQSLHDDNEKEPKDYRDRTARRQLIIRRVVAAVVSFIFIYSVLRVVNLVHRSVLKNDPGLRPIETLNSPSGSLKSKLETCSDTASPSHPPPARPPSPVNLWASLTIKETSEIQRWLEHPARSLNLTRGKESRPSDNTIFIIETFYPPKASALAYFDSLTDSKEVKPPARYARVTIHHGSGLPSPGDPIPQVKDYLVGPLPIGNGSATTIRELNEIYHLSRIPYNARGMVNGIEFSDAWKLIYGELREAIEDLLNSTIRGKTSDGLVVSGSGPWSFDGSFRRLWTTFKKNVPGSWIQATGLYIYLDMGGTDTSLWKFTKVVYNNQYFKSVSAFLEAYRNGSIKRYPPPSPPSPALSNYTAGRTDTTWSSRNRHGERRDLDHLPGPRSVAFAGLRFRVNRELGYVSWMGWGMYLGFDRDMGLSLWDVRFQGERVVYQLAPQEALAHYAGADPIQSSMSWQDRYWGMGQFVSNMLPGYDCPHNAVYLPATTRTPLGSTTVGRAICVFEHDTERPLTRHTSYVDGEFGAVKGYVLVVRSITPVGNYDYTFDYIFHLDGTIEVRVSASGYLMGGYWEPNEAPYGGRIRETNMGNIHDHVINFKVDFDIGGTNNSLLATTTREETVEHPWLDDDDWGSTRVQQKINKQYIENENDALLKYPPNFQGHYAIVNQDVKNRWGYPKGYIIHPGYNPVHATVVGSNKLTLENANWAKYNLAVSKRKETEPSSSSMWNMNLPGSPVVNFHKFFDGENITQEDLVVWVNVGTHHLPQAEDSPNTKMNTATSSFFLVPFNYFDHDVSMDSANAILLSTPKVAGDPFTYDDYGVKQDYTCIPEAPEPFGYRDIEMYDVEGRKEEPKSSEEMREMKEMYLRMRVKVDP